MRARKSSARRGFTLLDVAFAAVILIVGTMAMGRFFTSIYTQLSPKGEWGGLRRYLLAEEMLRAQAEGLRVLHDIPLTDVQCKLVAEPVGMNYSMTITRTQAPAQLTEQLYYYDIIITQGLNNQKIGSLSMSTVRAIGSLGGQDEKIGL
ncbi:MAG: hypothetical protein JWM80_4 [Cyanobacteria bacterium RYN_339]|nr:hypothetical protein [Cyanobacteria bacterium RYN_339]